MGFPQNGVTATGIAAAGGLLATNNLNDVAAAATARTNLGSAAASGLASLDSSTHTVQAVVRHGCRVYKDTVTAIGSGSLTALAGFNQERFDTDAYHDTVTNNGRITVPAGLAGVYFIAAHAEYANNITGARTLYLRINGTFYIAEQRFPAAIGTDVTGISVSTIWPMAVGDYAEVVAFQDSGSSVNIAAGDATPNGHTQDFTALLLSA